MFQLFDLNIVVIDGQVLNLCFQLFYFLILYIDVIYKLITQTNTLIILLLEKFVKLRRLKMNCVLTNFVFDFQLRPLTPLLLRHMPT